MKHFYKQKTATNTNMVIKNNTKAMHLGPLLLLNISIYTLAAICFMIYTTELNYVHAEGDEDLGSASSSIDASVTVGTACNFSGNVDIPHTSTIMNGVNSTDIGKTTLNATCNDQSGYAVYAIGYTNYEYGNNTLLSSVSSDYNIPTGTSTSGSTSNWSMKLATVPGTTTATIENDYGDYSTVPNSYTKVATLNTITNPGTSTTGSSISTTYQAYISPTQPAGTYSGKVKYTLVHPSTAPKPTFMQDVDSIRDTLTNIGDTMQVIDKRDNKVYSIAKLADSNIWMTQNLNLQKEALLPGVVIDNSNTDHPAPGFTLPTSQTSGDDDWGPADSETATNTPHVYDNEYNTEAYYYCETYFSSGSCATYSTEKVQNSDLGNYYNWYTATAGTGTYSTDYDEVASGSICPSGWRLPSGTNDYNGITDYSNLLYQYGINNGPTVTSGYSPDNVAKLALPPLNLLRTGAYAGSGTQGKYNIGVYGNIWSSRANYESFAEAFSFGKVNMILESDYNDIRTSGYSVRCIMQE